MYTSFSKVYSYPPNLYYNLQQYNLDYTSITNTFTAPMDDSSLFVFKVLKHHQETFSYKQKKIVIRNQLLEISYCKPAIRNQTLEISYQKLSFKNQLLEIRFQNSYKKLDFRIAIRNYLLLAIRNYLLEISFKKLAIRSQLLETSYQKFAIRNWLLEISYQILAIRNQKLEQLLAFSWIWRYLIPIISFVKIQYVFFFVLIPNPEKYEYITKKNIKMSNKNSCLYLLISKS